MKNILTSLFFLLCATSFAQQVLDSTFLYKNGKRYVEHIAQDGNTLYGLKTIYAVSEKEIISANPGIEKGLKQGSLYLIPKGAADVTVENGSRVLFHTVVKGETAYSLCKKYNCDLNTFNTMNLGSEKGLKLGQRVKILYNIEPIKQVEEKPVVYTTSNTSVVFSDSIINYTVKAKETIYTISKRFMVPAVDLQKFNNLKSTKIKVGDVLQIPLKKENIKRIEVREVIPSKEIIPIKSNDKIDPTFLFPKKDNYKIAILLPFGLSEPGTTSVKTLATEFYMGAKLAFDSLERKGLSATVQIIDFPQDTNSLKSFMNKELFGMDLVFGPLIPTAAEIVAKWCMQNKIRMVCPASIKPGLLTGNQYVYAAVASDETQMKALAKFSVRNHKQKTIILINTGNTKSKNLYDAYREAFIEESLKSANIKLIEAKISEYASFIKRNGHTVLVFPSEDKSTTIKFLNDVFKLKGKAGSGTITVLGTKDWANFDDITGNMKNDLNITWPTSADLNYKSENTKALLRIYRREFKADLNKFGAQGYDVVSYFTSYLLMDKTTIYQCMNNFHVEQTEPGSGFENKGVIIVQNQNFELIRIAEIDE